MALITPILKAPQYGSLIVSRLAVLQNELFGLADTGELLKWNDVNAWIQVAPTASGVTVAGNLIVYNNKLYMSGNGYLYEWNGTNNWTLRANPYSGANISSLCVHNGKLWGGSYDPTNDGQLYYWDDISAWVQAANSTFYNPATSSNSWDLAEIASFNGNIWIMNENGYLGEYTGSAVVLRTTNPIHSGTVVPITLLPLGSYIYAASRNQYAMKRWDGATDWQTVVADVPPEFVGQLFEHTGEIYTFSVQSSNDPVEKWDNAVPGTWIQVSDTTVGESFRQGISYAGNVYMVSNLGKLYLVDVLEDIAPIGIVSSEAFGTPHVSSTIATSAFPVPTRHTDGDMRFVLNSYLGYADVVLADRDVDRDEGFETAVLITIGTDRRAEEGDTLSDGKYKGGYWADEFSEFENFKLGCRLHLLRRSKGVDSVIAECKEYVKEGFQWMIEDGVIESLNVDVSRAEVTGLGSSVLLIVLEFIRPSGDNVNYKFYFNWESQMLRRTDAV